MLQKSLNYTLLQGVEPTGYGDVSSEEEVADAFTEDWSGMRGNFVKQFNAANSSRPQPNRQQKATQSNRAITVNDRTLSNQFLAKISVSEMPKPMLAGICRKRYSYIV